jgi:GntR family transcriptional regulator
MKRNDGSPVAGRSAKLAGENGKQTCPRFGFGAHKTKSVLPACVLYGTVHAVIPFRLRFRPGDPLHEQIVYAAKKAIISGYLRSGDPFPSVRALSKELKINPNTAHRVISELVEAGMLETRAGVGTVVTDGAEASAAERTELLDREMEELVVEAKVLGIDLQNLTGAVAAHWKRLAAKKR